MTTLTATARQQLGLIVPLDRLLPARSGPCVYGDDVWTEEWFEPWPSAEYRDELVHYLSNLTGIHVFTWGFSDYPGGDRDVPVRSVKRLGISLRGLLAFRLVCYRHVVELRSLAPRAVDRLPVTADIVAVIRFVRLAIALAASRVARVVSRLVSRPADSPRVLCAGGQSARFAPILCD